MLNHEEIYQLIFKKEWKKLLGFLHQKKTLFKSEPNLIVAAKIFEKEFIRELPNYSDNQKDIVECLETLYLLDHGNIYKLSDENKLVVYHELARRSPKEYYYLLNNPRDISKNNLISNKRSLDNYSREKRLNDNWVEIFNRLFEMMNVSEDPATYFSGPRLINLIRKYKKYHPDYMQYMDIRDQKGLSKTRRVYFQDLLEELEPNIRNSVIDGILDIIRPFDTLAVSDLELILNGNRTSTKSTSSIEVKKPIVFISYSWDSEDHKTWVLHLANKLIEDGVEVRLDRYSNKVGAPLQYNMEQSITVADKVIVIFTPGYKKKADNREGGVGYEYSIMTSDLYNNQTVNTKIIPVLVAGNRASSIPSFMQQYIHIDLSETSNFETGYTDLKHAIFDLS